MMTAGATTIVIQPGSRPSPPSRFPSGIVVTDFAAYSCGGSLGIGPGMKVIPRDRTEFPL